ncbi:hypothetical protein AXX12_11910 [Anaerosporomusa subterranea]|uniref:Diguanylate cyclase n=1 Tax=Anaerosporomusa subterranea TaxID=1794912 RepID=A0A154BPM1_ANASB|nr:EAL domain-containing protein [Anaerosporomusa subterranea]KYZ75892.1 hypothetical protein AXX12_11910 [Anaerosporomusa subterranea]
MSGQDKNQTEATNYIDSVFYKSILEQARDMIFIVATNGRIIEANHAAVNAYGYSLDELRQMCVHELRSPEMRGAIDSQLLRAQQDGILFRAVYLRKNGERFPAEVSSRRVQLLTGDAVVSIVRDITETVAAEAALKKSEAELWLRNKEMAATYEDLMVAHEELTATYEELTASEEELRQQFDELLSRDAEIRRQNGILTSLHDTAIGLMHRLDPEELLQQIVTGAAGLVGTPHGFIYRLDKHKGVFYRSHGVGLYETDIGREIPVTEGIVGTVYQTGEPVVVNEYPVWRNRYQSSAQFGELNSVLQIPLKSNGQVVGTIGLAYCEKKKVFGADEIEILSQFAELASIALDNALLNASLEEELRERKVREQAIWRLAYYDSLTGLPNRTYFQERLSAELDKARRGEATGAILHIDLDDLKLINDTLGHACGDEIIAKAGEYIVAGAGENALVARVAGDEFTILILGESDRGKVAHIADSLIKQLCREYEISESKVHMSGSMGIAFYPEDGDTAADVLTKADLALYEAKRSGKNAWRFCEAKSQLIAYENMLLRRDLREAVERGELALHYQPLVDAQCGCVVSFEALLRWTSSTYGVVPPSRFIPLAEESDMILGIGKWVLEESCRFIHKLAAMGNEDIHVSVNVSPRQLAADDFVALVRETIDREGINPKQLEIEITENVLITSMEESTRRLSELRAIGVRLSLDDFGTGYSSLTYLRSLPVGTLKLDKSFIDQILSDVRQLQFISSIINMAHVLGLAVVAEGVETEEQLEKLVECQCDFIQGYVFSRPVTEKEALLFLDW